MVKDNDILQAVRDQDVDNLQKLLQKTKNGRKVLHGSKRLNVNYQDDDGMAAIHQAALQGNWECVTLLLSHGSTVDLTDNRGMTALHYAAWQGALNSVTQLVQAGASTNHPSQEGVTPLHLCCQHGHLEVVRLLLKFNADPTIENNQFVTPLDMACEFGKHKVVELLIKSSLCTGILHSREDLTVNKNRSTPLHRAAKGGHVEVIKLLLDCDIDINRQTHQGTALHEAALYGKLDAVKLLIDAGIDVAAPNSYELTPLDIVHKFTRKAGARELKNVLQEASFAVNVRAVKSYSNSNDPQSLSFAAGDLITVVEQKPNGVWRGFVLRDGRKSSTGYFPSNCVALLNQYQTPRPCDREGASAAATADAFLHDSRHWYSSTSLASSDLASPTLHLPSAPSIPDCNNSNGGHYPPSSPSWRNSEMGVIPENRISMCSRSSSTSTDSRVNFPQSQPQSINGGYSMPNFHPRLSPHDPNRHSYDPMVMMSRQSFHSNSSSSMGSLDEAGLSVHINVRELYQQGFQDNKIIYEWLSNLRYEAYYENFMDAGYDMPTISRMTPEDLTAIGITKPSNRKKLTREISKLDVPDGIPDYIPESVHEWLEHLRLQEYFEVLESQSYNTIESVKELSWEDLEEIGIHKLGHQKKIMLAIERLKKIAKRQSQSGSISSRNSTPISGSTARLSSDMTSAGHFFPSECHPKYISNDSSSYAVPGSKSMGDILSSRPGMKFTSCDVVPIQLKSGLSRSSSGNSVNSSEYAVPRCQSFTAPTERDCTPPSSEDSGSSCSGSMQRSCSKKGPIKGIHGLSMSKHSSQDSIDQNKRSTDGVAQYATLRRSSSRKQSSQSLDFSPHGYPQSPVNKGNNGPTSPALGSLPSPFSEFRSPYAQIQSGEVKNQLQKDKRSSSVPSSPVTKAPSVSSSNVTKVRKPPAPPKRTLSMKTSDVSNDDFKKSDNNDEEEESFPPPLSPVAFSIEAMKSNQLMPSKMDYIDRRSPAKDSLKLQNVTESSLAARRRAGSVEKDSKNINNNNKSIMVEPPVNDSDRGSLIWQAGSETPRNSLESIPFANDNAGTIRQKTAQPKMSIVTSDFIEDDVDKALEFIDDDNTDADFNTVKRMPKPVMQVQPVNNDNLSDHIIVDTHSKKTGKKQDVLTDIDTMFESLTNELDAMLDVNVGSNVC